MLGKPAKARPRSFAVAQAATLLADVSERSLYRASYVVNCCAIDVVKAIALRGDGPIDASQEPAVRVMA